MLYAINDIIQAVVVVKINRYTRYFHPPASFVNTRSRQARQINHKYYKRLQLQKEYLFYFSTKVVVGSSGFSLSPNPYKIDRVETTTS